METAAAGTFRSNAGEPVGEPCSRQRGDPAPLALFACTDVLASRGGPRCCIWVELLYQGIFLAAEGSAYRAMPSARPAVPETTFLCCMLQQMHWHFGN